MNGRTRALVGASILALGAATFWLAASQAQADVRQVGEVILDPDSHMQGHFTMVGVPQAETIPITAPQGVVLTANPAWRNETRTTTSWTQDGTKFYSLHILRVAATPQGLEWTFRNETRRTPADTNLAFAPIEESWVSGAAGQAFPIEAFASGPGGPARIWALYGKATEHALQPKPSQFKGHLLATLPNGAPVPDGVLVWIVEEYTAGCSSKFIPPEAQAKYNVTA